MIEALELGKQYGNFSAVAGLTFSIPKGEVVGLLGPNGAGKTTTMRMLTTFMAPSSGTARVAGYDVVKQPEKVRASIGYSPETPPLYPELTVVEYLKFVAKLKLVPHKQVQASVDEAITRCFLQEAQRKLCSQLSRGFRQRVGIAGAIVHKPPVVILDEPTSGLDPAQIIDIRALIRDLREQHTVLLSTHILPEVAETCSRVVIIARGTKVADGSLAEMTKDMSLEKKFLAAVSGDIAPPPSAAATL